MILSFRQYLDPRILRIFALGVASGFPWVLIGSVLTLWLKDAGLSRTSIGYAGAIYAAYSINFIWSPLIDRVQKPLGINWGQRKSWILLSQLAMSLACIGVAQSDPSTAANLTVMLCLAIAVASATQDIAIDAYRIDSIPETETELISIGSSAAIAGWHTGFSGLGAAALLLAASDHFDWSSIYIAALLIYAILSLIVFFSPEPDTSIRAQAQDQAETRYLKLAAQQSSSRKWFSLLAISSPFIFAFWSLAGGWGLADSIKNSALYVPGSLLTGFMLLIAGIVLLNPNRSSTGSGELTQAATMQHDALSRYIAWLATSIVHPLLMFFRQNGARVAITILLFVVLFKIGEAFLGRMSLVFYREIGFSNEDIAFYSKLVGWGVTVFFALISGLFTARFGIIKGLFIAGIAMSASNLLFAAMAIVGPEQWLFAVTVVIDGFTSAWSNVAFVAFLSSLCHRAFTATQYALLASMGTLGRTLFASSSGQLVDGLNGDWTIFFIVTAVLVLPSLWLLHMLAKQYHDDTDSPTKGPL